MTDTESVYRAMVALIQAGYQEILKRSNGTRIHSDIMEAHDAAHRMLRYYAAEVRAASEDDVQQILAVIPRVSS